MPDQLSLFDAPEPDPARVRPVPGRTRETFTRSVCVEITLSDREALRAAARSASAHVVMIDETGPDAGPDNPPEDIETDPAVALRWCIEPAAGLESLLRAGAARVGAVHLEVAAQGPDHYRATWSVQLKLRDAALLRERARALCRTEAERAEVGRSLAAAWSRIADPYAPITMCPASARSPVPSASSRC